MPDSLVVAVLLLLIDLSEMCTNARACLRKARAHSPAREREWLIHAAAAAAVATATAEQKKARHENLHVPVYCYFLSPL